MIEALVTGLNVLKKYMDDSHQLFVEPAGSNGCESSPLLGVGYFDLNDIPPHDRGVLRENHWEYDEAEEYWFFEVRD